MSCGNSFECSQCPGNLKKSDFGNFQLKLGNSKRCKACAGVAEMDQSPPSFVQAECHREECRVSHSKGAWTKQERKDIRKNNFKSSCVTCEELGYTTSDTKSYTCSNADCGVQGGRLKFDEESMRKHKKKKSRLYCIACSQEVSGARKRQRKN